MCVFISFSFFFSFLSFSYIFGILAPAPVFSNVPYALAVIFLPLKLDVMFFGARRHDQQMWLLAGVELGNTAQNSADLSQIDCKHADTSLKQHSNMFKWCQNPMQVVFKCLFKRVKLKLKQHADAKKELNLKRIIFLEQRYSPHIPPRNTTLISQLTREH